MKNNLLNNNINNIVENIITTIFNNLNCVKIGKIIKFYPEDKTADVQIITKIKDSSSTIKTYTLLSKCLVIGNKITLPIEEGEQVIILFNDYDLNAYFETGEVQEPYSERKHNLSDGIVICGLNSIVNAINYDNSAICLNYSQSRINGNLEVNGDQVNNGNININGNTTTTGNNEAATYSVGGVAGISGSFTDTGAGATGLTLTITNGLITGIN